MLTAARKLVNAGWSPSALNGCNNLIPILMTEKLYTLTEALYFKFVRKKHTLQSLIFKWQNITPLKLYTAISPSKKKKSKNKTAACYN